MLTKVSFDAVTIYGNQALLFGGSAIYCGHKVRMYEKESFRIV